MSTLEIILSFLSPILLGIGAWFGSRKKDNAAAAQSEIENVEKALGIYRGIILDLTKEVEKLKAQVTDIVNQLRVVEEENRKLKRNENH